MCPTGTESPTWTCLHHRRHGRGDCGRIDGSLDLDPNTPDKAISIEPAKGLVVAELGSAADLAGSGTISIGSNFIAGARADPANRCRQAKSWLAFTSCRRATIDTDAPGSNVSATS
jgi:hypothetical protein